jgi:hypothetical protein
VQRGVPVTLADLIVVAEDVADKAIRANVGPLKWELVKHDIHPITEQMVRDGLGRLAPFVLPVLRPALKILQTVETILTEAQVP